MKFQNLDFWLQNKESLKKIKPLFCDKCHKPGEGGLETQLSKKNNHVSKSFSSHLKHF